MALGDETCLLVVTSISGASPRLPAFTASLGALCAAHAWVRASLNFFSGQVPPSLPTCVASTSSLPGFKSLHWKHALAPRAVRSYTHIFLVDADMEVAPRHFELAAFVRLASATNVSVLGPVASGSGNALHRLNNECGDESPLHARCRGSPKCAKLCAADPERLCAVCRQPVVEVKAPMFTRAAWAVVHRLVLSGAPDDALVTDVGLDLTWCDLLNHKIHGCDPRGATATKGCLAQVGQACAVSYATPMLHYDDRLVGAGNNYTAVNRRGKLKAHLRREGIDSYIKMPHWRPAGSLLSSQMCWSVLQLRAASPPLAAAGWRGVNTSGVLTRVLPGAPACCAQPRAERRPIDDVQQGAKGCPRAESAAVKHVQRATRRRRRPPAL